MSIANKVTDKYVYSPEYRKKIQIFQTIRRAYTSRSRL